MWPEICACVYKIKVADEQLKQNTDYDSLHAWHILLRSDKMILEPFKVTVGADHMMLPFFIQLEHTKHDIHVYSFSNNVI